MKSQRKTESAQQNGRLGGRPGNPHIKQIMAELGCSRQWAHELLKKRQEEGNK